MHSIHRQQLSPWQRAPHSRHCGMEPCWESLSRAAPKNPAPGTGDISATTSSPQPPACLSQQAWTVASPLQSSGAPQAVRGMLRGTSLTLAWHLVWQDSLQPKGGREGTRLVEAGECIAGGQLTSAAHAGLDRKWAPLTRCIEHPGTWHKLPGHAHTDAHTSHTTLASALFHQRGTDPCAHGCHTQAHPHVYEPSTPRCHRLGSVWACQPWCPGVDGTK